MNERGAKRARGRVPDPERTTQTRQLILRAALDSFLERGFEGTRMADVAARAGLAKGTLYLHFADKQALFEFVLRELISEPLAAFRAVPPLAGDSARAVLERLVLPLLRDLERSGRAAVLRLIITEGGRFPELAAMHRRLVIEPFLAAVREKVAGSPALAAFERFPQLMVAPVIMAAVWNGLWGRQEQLDAAEVFSAFLDLVFGPGSC
ncbi:MAG: TetR/AcrR family transcriptional regulator [Acetobacteraceae bacterium]|nr:TetR/AcrR family transcriptional regulator [Acetobacteraceae bacterium]